MATATRKIRVRPAAKGEPKTKKAEKADINAKPKVVKAPVPMHETATAYAGASPLVRAGRNLSPVVLDRVPNAFTARDEAFLRALHKEYGTKEFERLNYDAGAMSRLIGFGYLDHKGGKLDERTAKFAITGKALKERFAKA